MNSLDKENNKEKFIFGCILLFANKMQTIGDRFDKDITMKQWLLLICILENKDYSPTLTTIAEFMGCSRQNVKKLASKLNEKGLIKIENDPNDSRSLKLSITKKCEKFFERRKNAEDKFLEDFFKKLTETDINNVYSAFLKLSETIANLDETSKAGFSYGNLDYLTDCDDDC